MSAAAEAKLAKSLDSIIEDNKKSAFTKKKPSGGPTGMRIDGGRRKIAVAQGRGQSGGQQQAPRQRGGAGFGTGLGTRGSGIRKRSARPAYTFDMEVDDGDYGMGGGRDYGTGGGRSRGRGPRRQPADPYAAAYPRSGPTPRGNPDGQWSHDLFDDTDDAPVRRMRPGRLAGRIGNVADPNSARLKISNLHYTVVKEDVEELFSACGKLKSAKMMYDASDRPTGEAFVEFESRADALKAIKEYNGIKLDGQELKIELSDESPHGLIVKRLSSGKTVVRANDAGMGFKRVMRDVVSEAQGAPRGGPRMMMGGGGGGGFGGRMGAPTRNRLRSGVVKSKADLDAEMDTMMQD